jgi:hypothetical protein
MKLNWKVIQTAKSDISDTSSDNSGAVRNPLSIKLMDFFRKRRLTYQLSLYTDRDAGPVIDTQK